MTDIARPATSEIVQTQSLGIPATALFVWTLSSLDQSLFGYALPGIMAEFGMSLSAMGAVLSASFLSAAVTTILIGMLADRYGRRLLLCICLGGSATLVSLTAMSPDLGTLAVLRVASFALANALSPLTATMVSEAVPKKRRSLVMGILQCGFPIGWCLASLAAAPLLEAHGWRATFLCALPVIAIALILYRVLPPGAGGGGTNGDTTLAERLQPFREKALLKRTAWCWLAFIGYGGAYAGTAFYLPAYFQMARGFSPSAAARIVGASYGIAIVGYLSAAIVGQYWLSRRRTAIIWCLAGAACYPAFLWLPTTAWQDIALFGVTALFFYGASAVLVTFAAELFPPEIRATGMSLSASLGLNLGFAVFPPITATLIDWYGWREAFTGTVLVLLGVTVVGLKACGETRR